ncbi:protein phosphatase 1 regulatory subunit 12B isoform X4 [Protopterus annectens]|uniref:protein phosphatase 1 regulatory subunit 12B isoform X4 n=1 Tax=Protopterus annectens TaxID=7888 RepID=UPI001CFBBC06|nr:protein phosphatase 1 regulatory subunit 12B isoform X4 [Protopterus annectens]
MKRFQKGYDSGALRSYLTPVRDEEAESQRRARSRQARQTRRPTQGLILTDIEEAKQTLSRYRAERRAQEQQRDKAESSEPQEKKELRLPETTREPVESRPRWNRSSEDVVSQPVFRRSRYLSQPESPSSPLTSPSTLDSFVFSGMQGPPGNGLTPSTDSSINTTVSRRDHKEASINDGERKPPEDDTNHSIPAGKFSQERQMSKESIRDYESFLPCTTEHERLSSSSNSRLDPSSRDTGSDRALSRTTSGSYSRRENRLSSLNRPEEDSVKDYKKLYEEALSENGRLKTKVQEAQEELAGIRVQMDRSNQERTTDKSSMLETEKKEKRALQRKMSEMEEEVKVLSDLKNDNQRLKDENGALIRVISKLSK